MQLYNNNNTHSTIPNNIRRYRSIMLVYYILAKATRLNSMSFRSNLTHSSPAVGTSLCQMWVTRRERVFPSNTIVDRQRAVGEYYWHWHVARAGFVDGEWPNRAELAKKKEEEESETVTSVPLFLQSTSTTNGRIVDPTPGPQLDVATRVDTHTHWLAHVSNSVHLRCHLTRVHNNNIPFPFISSLHNHMMVDGEGGVR